MEEVASREMLGSGRPADEARWPVDPSGRVVATGGLLRAEKRAGAERGAAAADHRVANLPSYHAVTAHGEGGHFGLRARCGYPTGNRALSPKGQPLPPQSTCLPKICWRW